MIEVDLSIGRRGKLVAGGRASIRPTCDAVLCENRLAQVRKGSAAEARRGRVRGRAKFNVFFRDAAASSTNKGDRGWRERGARIRKLEGICA